MTSTSTESARTHGSGELTHRQILTIMAGLMLGMFLAALDQTIVATAIRTIGDDLHGLSVQAWVTTAYLITSTITTPLYGKLSDIYGRKPLFLFAISIFIVGSALCSFVDVDVHAGRVPRASRASAPAACSRWRWRSSATSSRRASARKYQGYFLAVFGTSSVLGPVIGGFFAGQATILGITGWRWVFLVNVPIGDRRARRRRARVLHIPHTRRDAPHRLAGRARADRRPGAAADRRRAGPRLGLGLARARSPATLLGVVGLVAVRAGRAPDAATTR